MNNFFKEILAIKNVISFNFLNKRKRQITFYSEGKNYWPHIKGLLKNTLEKTDFSVCYVSSSLDDPGIDIKHPNLETFYIGMSNVRNYFFENVETDMMIMTMPDLHNYQIKRSSHKVHYVYVQHSLVSLHCIYRHGAFDHYDTICAAGTHHVNEIRALEKKYQLPKKNIIELGYSRLDYLSKTIEQNLKSTNEIKTILIAPSWGPKGLIESGLGKKLVDRLIDLGLAVILRPHPQTLKFQEKKVHEITNQYRWNKNFFFENNVSGERSFFNSDIMISDWSGVALEYALCFNKPVIFCEIPKKINNPNYEEINIEPIEVIIREDIGLIWDGITPIENIIKVCNLKIKSSDELEILRKKVCFNIGLSDDMFVKFLIKKLH